MRILFCLHLYPPVHMCGSELVAHTVLKYMQSKGHDVRVLLHRDNGMQTPYIYDGIEVMRSTGHLDAYRWCDVMMTHLDFTQEMCIVSMQVEKPLIHFIHNDIEYSCIVGGIRGHHVVYNSQWCREKINYKWPSVVLHPPCYVKDYEIDNTGAKAITLISLNQMKGGYFLRQLAKAMPERKFIGVVGSYDNKEPEPNGISQGKIIELLQELPNVTIVPNSPDIKSVYKQTRILIMPSLYESWGRTATEAMCSGIPVICTPTNGLLENLSYAGKFVGSALPVEKRGEPQVDRGELWQWMNAIYQLDNEKEYEKYSLLCRKRAQELDPLKELEALETFILSARF